VARARSLSEFQTSFPDETSCAAFLFQRRWPQGFACPACGGGREALLKSRAHTYECLDCGRQTSITAGTAMHRFKSPLTVWFWARRAPSPDELLGYRRTRQSPQRRADSPARAAAPQDSDRHAGRPIKTSR